ncbi:MAG TPA: response regulator [Pyrinomonadaceae bacterium]|nr:response regulator [Pyrinomonadaceae bacterium]
MSKRRILYIEDHEDTRDLVTLVLKERDYEVTEATTLESAVKLAQDGKYHLYLIDSWLPDGSGIDFCNQIRQLDQNTPIVFYSAAAYEDDKALALAAGAQGYLTKPSSVKELCDLIAELMDA